MMIAYLLINQTRKIRQPNIVWYCPRNLCEMFVQSKLLLIQNGLLEIKDDSSKSKIYNLDLKTKNAYLFLFDQILCLITFYMLKPISLCNSSKYYFFLSVFTERSDTRLRKLSKWKLRTQLNTVLPSLIIYSYLNYIKITACIA